MYPADEVQYNSISYLIIISMVFSGFQASISFIVLNLKLMFKTPFTSTCLVCSTGTVRYDRNRDLLGEGVSPPKLPMVMLQLCSYGVHNNYCYGILSSSSQSISCTTSFKQRGAGLVSISSRFNKSPTDNRQNQALLCELTIVYCWQFSQSARNLKDR